MNSSKLKNVTSLKNVYSGKRVLITGHTGFKGSWLAIWLALLGAKICGASLAPPTRVSHFDRAGVKDLIDDVRINITDGQSFLKLIKKFKPDFVFHLAAQSLVNESYISPRRTWETNVIGTISVLESLRKIDRECCVVMITSDKCYENQEWIWGYRENDRLWGIDPYSASKASAEQAIDSYIKCFFQSSVSQIRIAVGRAGNVIGGGDWAKNRLIPDIVRAAAIGDTVVLRNPDSTRPWQHVLEPLFGYLTLAARLSDDKRLHGEAFNFGPHNDTSATVKEVVETISKYWQAVRYSLDIVKPLTNHESGLLKLSSEKAESILGWRTLFTLEDSLRLTANWYKDFYERRSKVLDLSITDIETYENFLQRKQNNPPRTN